MFIFLIHYQQKFCLKHLELIKGVKKSYAIEYPEANKSFINLAAASVRYRTATESISGYLKSFIPFTAPFKARLEVARQISETHKCFNEVMKLIWAAKRKEKALKLAARDTVKDEAIPVSDNVLPKVYPPPFKEPAKPKTLQQGCIPSFWPTFKF